MITVREVVLQVNQAYIRSAAQADAYRTEPPFLLQGSYRNMNRLAEKVLPIMNDDEVQLLISSHYERESQVLTTGAEFNLLKFKEMVGWITDDDAQRLADIRHTFQKNNALLGLGDTDRMVQVLSQLGALADGLGSIRDVLADAAEHLPDRRRYTLREIIEPDEE